MVLELQLEMRERGRGANHPRSSWRSRPRCCAPCRIRGRAGVGDDGAEVVDGVARSRMATKAAWCFPLLAAPPKSDRARSVGGFRGAAVNFGYRALGPHPLFYCGAARWGSTTIDWLIAPDHGANQGFQPLGWARSTLTASASTYHISLDKCG